jgi:hypothetical protein
MINVQIINPPLYGSVYWDGIQFVYTPGDGFTGSDYYIYSAVIDGVKQTKTNYISYSNTPPVVLNPSLTATSKNVNIIPIGLLASDITNPFNYLDVISVSGALKGTTSIQNNSIYYQSNGFNSVEILNYEVSDKQYTTTGTLTLSVTDGISIPDFPPDIQQILNGLLSRAKTIEDLSAHWMDTYSVLTSFSANWNSPIDYINFITSISSDWILITSIESLMNSFASIMNSNSSLWDSNYTQGVLLYDIINPKQEKYNDFYNFISYISGVNSSLFELSTNYYNIKPILDDIVNTVSSNSASSWDTTELNTFSANNFDNWVSTTNLLTSRHPYYDSSLYYVGVVSAILDGISAYNIDTFNTVSSNSASNWGDFSLNDINNYINNYNILTANSANWNPIDILDIDFDRYNQSYNTLQDNITSKWEVNFTNKLLSLDIPNWNSTYNTLKSLSSGWSFDESRESLAFYNNLTSNSSNWNNTYTELQTNSSNNIKFTNNVTSLSTKYLTGDFDIDFVTKDLFVTNDFFAKGTINILGNVQKYDNTIVTTSAFVVYNESTNNALDVEKIGGLPIATFKNPASARVLHINTPNSVGINMPYDTSEALTVSGNISASGRIYPYLSDTINTYKTVSASYEQTYSVLNANSATTIANFVSNKPKYDSLANYVNLSSSVITDLLTGNYLEYNAFYAATTSQSAQNIKMYSSLSSVSAGIGIDTHFRNRKFIYDGLYAAYLNMI